MSWAQAVDFRVRKLSINKYFSNSIYQNGIALNKLLNERKNVQELPTSFCCNVYSPQPWVFLQAATPGRQKENSARRNNN